MLKYQNAEHSNGNYSVRASSAQGVDTNPLQSLSSVTSYCLLFNVLSPVSGKVLGGKQQKLNGADLCKKVINNWAWWLLGGRDMCSMWGLGL